MGGCMTKSVIQKGSIFSVQRRNPALLSLTKLYSKLYCGHLSWKHALKTATRIKCSNIPWTKQQKDIIWNYRPESLASRCNSKLTTLKLIYPPSRGLSSLNYSKTEKKDHEYFLKYLIVYNIQQDPKNVLHSTSQPLSRMG